jgi:hydroxyacylglutathione hydrolase
MEIIPITTKYLFDVNCYLIKTEAGFFLIDTGMKKKRAQIEKALEKAGCNHGDLRLIIITHGHLDHVGNAAYLRDKYGSKIAMHLEEVRMAESGDMFIDKGGIVVGLVSVLMSVFGLSGYERFTPDVYLGDKQDLSEYGLPATVLHTPGHSNGSISLLTEDGILFCGDIYGNAKKPEKTTLIQNQGDIDTSVKKIKSLDVNTFYPGHGPQFTVTELE